MLEVFFLRDDVSGRLTTADLWIMAAINIVLAVAAIGLFGGLIREKVSPNRPLPETGRRVSGSPAATPAVGFSTGEVR